MSNEEVITRTEDYYANFRNSYFSDSILKLETHLDKLLVYCSKKNCVENMNQKNLFSIVL